MPKQISIRLEAGGGAEECAENAHDGGVRATIVPAGTKGTAGGEEMSRNRGSC